MKQFLQQTILENSVQLYLCVFGTILISLLIKRLLSKYLAGVLFKLVDKNDKRNNKLAFISLIIPPLELFLVLLIASIALDKLNFPQSINFIFVHAISLKTILEAVLNGTLVIAFVWLCLRIVDFIALIVEQKANAANHTVDKQFVVFFRDFFKVIIALIGLLLLLHFCFNQNIGNVFTGLSIVGAALALATRESLENLIASFIIFFDKPFSVGEVVKVQNLTGTIEKIGLRSTRIRTLEKTYITVPNKQMVDSIVDNISLRTQRKVELKLELDIATQATALEKTIADIKKCIDAETMVENSVVYLSDTGKNAHIVLIDYFTNIAQETADFQALCQRINLKIIVLLEQNEVKLAAANTWIIAKEGQN